MKFIYFYNNESSCTINSFDEYDILKGNVNNFISHSKEVSQKTINREKGNNKFVHIFKERKPNGYTFWQWYASYCI